MNAGAARPLRALAIILLLYLGGRIAVLDLYPDPPAARGGAVSTPGRARRPVPVAVAAVRGVAETSQPPAPKRLRASSTIVPARGRSARLTIILAALAGEVGIQSRVTSPVSYHAEAAPPLPPTARIGDAAAVPVMAAFRKNLSGSAWLLVRDGNGKAALAPGGTLAGSQAGARIIWQPTSRPVFLTMRASAALAARDTEIAPGIGVRGKSAGVIAEQRLDLDRGGSETAVVAYGGFSDVKAPLGLRLDGYGQAGAVGLKRRALFADGAVGAERTVTELGRGRLNIGGAVWGAAQPGLARLDVGPQLVLHLPAVSAGVRVSADYRFRIAGNASPSSGPAITLGADF